MNNFKKILKTQLGSWNWRPVGAELD